MGDLWDDEGFGSGAAAPEADAEDEWDEGDESLDTALEDGYEDPAALGDAREGSDDD